jgi:hypothetical protein
LRRAYYHCSSCQKGVYPHDAACGLDESSLFPAVTRMVGSVGARVSFQEGRDLLDQLAGVRATTKRVCRWIWNLALEHFPQAVQILDRYPTPKNTSPTPPRRSGDRNRKVSSASSG